MIALGKFTDGEVWIHEEAGQVPLEISPEEGDASAEYRAGRTYMGNLYDPAADWVVFDGRRLHCTMPFKGTRYSLVFFTGPDPAKAEHAVKHEMFEAGFDFDWDEEAVVQATEACRKPSGTIVYGKSADRSASTDRGKDGGGPGCPTISEGDSSKTRKRKGKKEAEKSYVAFEDFAPVIVGAYEVKEIHSAAAKKIATLAKGAFDSWPAGVGAAGYSGASFDETGKVEAVPAEGV